MHSVTHPVRGTDKSVPYALIGALTVHEIKRHIADESRYAHYEITKSPAKQDENLFCGEFCYFMGRMVSSLGNSVRSTVPVSDRYTMSSIRTPNLPFR